MKKISKVLVFVLAFVTFATLESNAQTSKESACSAKGIFGSCNIYCGPTQNAKCSGRFFASCECEGMYYLNKIVPNQENINEFAGLLGTLESAQSKESQKLFVQTQELMKGKNGKAYFESATNFEKSLTSLPESEKFTVDAWVNKKLSK